MASKRARARKVVKRARKVAKRARKVAKRARAIRTTPSKHAVKRAVSLIQQAHNAIRAEGQRRITVRESSYRRTVDEYIKDVYVPRGKGAARRKHPTADERRYIIERTTVGAVARRKVKRDDATFRKAGKRSKHKGKYQVMVPTRTHAKGEWVSAAVVKRSQAARAYWTQVRMIREALDDEVSTRDVRRMLRVINDAGLDATALIADTSPDLSVVGKGRGPKTLKGAIRRHERQVREGTATRTAEEMIARYRR